MQHIVFAVIAILLMAVVTLAGMFFGGTTFFNNTTRTAYTKAVNGGSQIEAAFNLYLARYGRYPQGTSDEILERLVAEGFLNDIPDGDWNISHEMIVRPIVDLEQCQAINKQAGKDISLVTAPDPGCPTCDDAVFTDFPACQGTL